MKATPAQRAWTEGFDWGRDTVEQAFGYGDLDDGYGQFDGPKLLEPAQAQLPDDLQLCRQWLLGASWGLQSRASDTVISPDGGRARLDEGPAYQRHAARYRKGQVTA